MSDAPDAGAAVDELPAYEELAPPPEPETLADYARAWVARRRAGDLGSLPIIVGLFLIAAIFGTLNDVFFTPANFVNLLLQMTAIATIAIGVVFVLLIGEIDLSVAFVSAVGAVIMALLLRPGDPGWPWPAAVGAALAITTAIGLVQGLVITKAGVPSFVVTLAGFLIWSGVVLILTTQASTAGIVVVQNQVVLDIANRFLSELTSWILAGAVVLGFAASRFRRLTQRRRLSLATGPMAVLFFEVAALAAILAAAVDYANRSRGVPVAVVILAVLIVLWSLVASRTRFGRHVYAIGGSAEAARRAGINVDRVRVMVFMISGFMAGVGGIILASRLRSVATNTGGGNLLLLVIAAAVIGGTSLFGGRGRVIHALLGALVIASVQNGMDLLGLAAGVKFVVTGLVLLAAVLVDSLAKQRRRIAGAA